MLRLWKDIHAQRAPVSTSAVVSIAAHAALIAVSVVLTARPSELPSEGDAIANRAYFIPPPNRVPGHTAAAEHLEFIALSPPGPGTGLGPTGLEGLRPAAVTHPTPVAGNSGTDSLSSAPRDDVASPDSVLTEIEVDSAARRDPNSAGPAYPPELLKKNVQGSVQARYVVDTTGLADVATLIVLSATDPQFADAVRAALPLMRFEPARLGRRKVRQQVEQEFTFRIIPPKLAETVKKP